MATTQDIEAGLKPGGVAPVSFDSPPQPLDLPPPYYVAAPDTPAQPAPIQSQTQVVDRQAYWLQQKQLADEAAATEKALQEQRNAEFQRTMASLNTIRFDKNGPTEAFNGEASTPARIGFLSDESSYQPQFDNSDTLPEQSPFLKAQIAERVRRFNEQRQQEDNASFQNVPPYQAKWGSADFTGQSPSVRDPLNLGALSQSPETQLAIGKLTQFLGPKGVAALRSSAIVQQPFKEGTPSAYEDPGKRQIVTTAPNIQWLAHELAHSFEDLYVTPEQKVKFQEDVYNLAARGDQTAQDAIKAFRGDPQHIYTYFAEQLFSGKPIPPSLQPYYSGLFNGRSDQLAKAIPEALGKIIPQAIATGEAGIGQQILDERAKRQQAAAQTYANPATEQLAQTQQEHQVSAPYTGFDVINPHAYFEADIPGAKAVRGAVGEAARGLASVPYPTDLIPGLDTRDARQAIAGNVAESLVPTTLGAAAPELIPGFGLGPDAARVLRGLAKQAGRSIEEFVASDAGRAAIKTLREGEAGQFRLPGKRPAFDAEGRPIEMQSGEPYAQFDSSGNPIDPATKELLPTAPIANRLSAEQTPADQAAMAISEWLRVGEKIRPEQEAMFAQERAQRAGKMEAVYQRGGTSAEAMAAGGGGFPRPFLAPLQMTPEGEQALRGEIRQSTIMGHPGNKSAAEKAIDAMQAGVLPEPNQAIQLSKIIGGPEFLQLIEKRAPRDWGQEMLGVLGIPKALQSFLDASAIGRQMAPLGFANPTEYIDAIGTIGRAAHSLESARAVQAETDAIPWVTEGGNAAAEALGINFRNLGGRMADIGSHLHESEGQFSAINRSVASRAVEKIPGYQLSERIYNVPINRERGLVFSKTAQNMWDMGERRPERYRAVADVIDHASGWSNAKPAEIVKGFNAFYSARNLAARFQVIFDPILQSGSLFQPSARQLAAKNLVGFVAANASMLGLMAGSGALAGKMLGIPNPVHIGLDPRSPDGFKGRIGNVRIDMTAGYGSIIRLVAQLSPAALSPYTLATEGKWSNPRVKSVGGIVRNASAVDLVDNFFANKQDPIFHILYNAMKFPGGEAYAEDLRSQEGLRTAAFHLFTPFFVQDVTEAWRQQGLQGAITAAPVSFLGGGVNTFEQSAAQQSADAKASAVPALEKVGARIQDGRVWPKVLDTDFAGQAWKSEFARDNPELGDLSKYQSYTDLRSAYVDYWYAKNGAGTLGERATKAKIAAAFDKQPASALWAKNVDGETMKIWKADPQLLLQQIQAGNTQTSKEKEQILRDAGLLQ